MRVECWLYARIAAVTSFRGKTKQLDMFWRVPYLCTRDLPYDTMYGENLAPVGLQSNAVVSRRNVHIFILAPWAYIICYILSTRSAYNNPLCRLKQRYIQSSCYVVML